MRQSKGKIKAIFGGIAAVLALALFLLLPHVLPPADGTDLSDAPFQIHVIDVGQGDAMLLICREQTVLIDSGTNASEGVLLAYLDSHGVERIDYLIISHPHEDHMGGADMVLREYEVGVLVMSDLAPDADVGMSFTTALIESDATVMVPRTGEVLQAGWDVGVGWQDGRAFHGPCHLRLNLALPLSRVQEAFRRLDKFVFNAGVSKTN